MKRNPKTLIVLLLSMLLLGGAALAGGCLGTKQQPAQITKDITPQEAFALIQENQTNPNFAIIDVRTPEEFASGHIEDAINIDYKSETFQDQLDILDKNKTYLIYCRSGRRSASALSIMEELHFREVYNMTGGIIEWMEEGLPTVQETPDQTIGDITPEEAFALIQENKTNPDFVIIDVGTPEEFADGHIEGAINIDSYSDTFRDELNQLDRNNTYLIYCRCPGRGISGKTADIMAELNFREVYVLLEGLDQWKADGFPTIQKIPAETETPSQESSVSEYLNQLEKELEKEEVKTITPEEAYALMQSNPGYVIIDTRTLEAFANEHIEGAINIDYQSENFRDELNQLDKNKTTFAYYKPYGRTPQCCGTDAFKAALDIFQTLKGLKFEEAYFIYGGIIAWKIKGLPTTK